MHLFNPENRTRSAEHIRIYILFEIWNNSVENSEALCFIKGTEVYLWHCNKFVGTW